MASWSELSWKYLASQTAAVSGLWGRLLEPWHHQSMSFTSWCHEKDALTNWRPASDIQDSQLAKFVFKSFAILMGMYIRTSKKHTYTLFTLRLRSDIRCLVQYYCCHFSTKTPFCGVCEVPSGNAATSRDDAPGQSLVAFWVVQDAEDSWLVVWNIFFFSIQLGIYINLDIVCSIF